MLTKTNENMIKLHTHTHTHNCYRKVPENFYTNFVKNVNVKNKRCLVKGNKFL